MTVALIFCGVFIIVLSILLVLTKSDAIYWETRAKRTEQAYDRAMDGWKKSEENLTKQIKDLLQPKTLDDTLDEFWNKNSDDKKLLN